MEDCRVGRVMSEHALTQGVGTAKDRLVGSAKLSSLLGATFSGCGASRSSSFHNTERDGCLAHVVKAPCSGGDVLAHARSRAKEVPELVVAAAISCCQWNALETEHWPTSALD